MHIVGDVISNIILERIREFNRRNGLKVSGTKKELVNFIEKAVLEGKLNQTDVEEFIADEICHGKNRIIFVSTFPDTSVTNLQNKEYITQCLRKQNFRTVDYNNLSTSSCPEETELVYLKVLDDSEIVTKISMCFAKKVVIKGIVDEEGEELPPRNETEYVWSEIIPTERKLYIKTRQRSGHHATNNARIKELYEEVSTIVRETFDLSPRSMESVKNILYKMFRDLTEKAEHPSVGKNFTTREPV